MKLYPSLLLGLLLLGTPLSHAAPEPTEPLNVQPLKLDQLASPFLMLTPAELAQLKKRVASDPADKAAFANLIAAVDEYVSKPMRFPDSEAGGGTKACPTCNTEVVYDLYSPKRHFCPKCKDWREGEKLDRFWNTVTFLELPKRLEQVGAAALLSGNPKYATALKETWLDLATNYPKFRLHEKSMRFDEENPPPTSGLATWQSIDEAVLVTRLGYSWDALLATKILTAQEREFIERGFWQVSNRYFHRVMDLKGSGGNWWVWHAAGSLTAGVFSRDLKLVDRAFNEPKAGMIPFLATNYIRKDGLVDERSSGYQMFAMEAFSRMAHLSKRLGLGFEENIGVRSGFTGYMRFLLPDYSLPCMNDSARYRFTNPWQDEKNGWIRFVDVMDLGWAIYQDPLILQSLRVLQAVPTVAENRGHRLYALLYGPAELKPVPFALPSAYLPESGVAMLRSPDTDWTLLFKNNPRPLGHAHANAVQFAMFANGEEFIPSFGACSYGSPFYLNWFVRSLASNTISFNMLSQGLGPIDNQMLWGIYQGPVQAAYALSRRLQSAADPGPAAQMNRLVLLTPLAMVEIVRVEPDDTRKNASIPINQLDSLLHFNGTLVWTPQAQPAASPLQIPSLETLQAEFKEQEKAQPTKRLRFRDQHAEYRLLENPQSVTAGEGGFIRGELTQPKGGKVALALFPMSKEESAWQFTGPGFEFDPNTPLPRLMRRLAANEARFGTVAIPFRDKNPLKSVKLLVDTPSATVLRLETANGSETILHTTKTGALSRAGSKTSLHGKLGVITEAKTGRIYTLFGESLQDAAGRLSADKPVPVQMRMEGNRPVFEKLGEDEVTVTWTPTQGQPVSKKL